MSWLCNFPPQTGILPPFLAFTYKVDNVHETCFKQLTDTFHPLCSALTIPSKPLGCPSNKGVLTFTNKTTTNHKHLFRTDIRAQIFIYNMHIFANKIYKILIVENVCIVYECNLCAEWRPTTNMSHLLLQCSRLKKRS